MSPAQQKPEVVDTRGRPIPLGSELGSGGEGIVYEVGHNADKAAKKHALSHSVIENIPVDDRALSLIELFLRTVLQTFPKLVEHCIDAIGPSEEAK